MDWIKNFGFKIDLKGIYALAAVFMLFSAIILVFAHSNNNVLIVGLIGIMGSFLLGIVGLLYENTTDENMKLFLMTMVCAIIFGFLFICPGPCRWTHSAIVACNYQHQSLTWSKTYGRTECYCQKISINRKFWQHEHSLFRQNRYFNTGKSTD